MAEFRQDEIAQTGPPMNAGAEHTALSRDDAAGIIAASLVSMAIYPESKELVDTIGEQVKQFEAARKADARAGDPDVAIRYSIDLDSKVLTAANLLERYRAAGHEAYEPWAPVWSQFSSVAELNRRRAGQQLSETAQPFRGRVVGWLQGGDHPCAAGLYLVNKTWEEQQEAAAAKIEAYDAGHAKTRLWLPALGDFVLAHAAEAEAFDGVKLDRHTASRLVQYDMCPVLDFGLAGPSVDAADDGKLGVGGSLLGLARPGVGVRFLMKLPEA